VLPARRVRRPVADRDLATGDERGERCTLAAQARCHGQGRGEGEHADDAGNTDEAEQRAMKAMPTHTQEVLSLACRLNDRQCKVNSCSNGPDLAGSATDKQLAASR
jgi:hypothetical protein